MVFRAGLVTVILVLTGMFTGCSADPLNMDDESLDRFSHAYADFRSAAYAAEISAHVSAADEDPFGFWRELRGALDVRGTNSSRVGHATAAKELYGSAMAKAVDQWETDIDKVDESVLHLVETANAIHTAEYRADAVEVAKAARVIHSAFESAHNLWKKRLGIQIDILRTVLLDGGHIQATPLFTSRAEQVKAISADIEAAAQRSSEAAQKLRDAFSALKGKSGVKEYSTGGVLTPAQQKLLDDVLPQKK